MKKNIIIGILILIIIGLCGTIFFIVNNKEEKASSNTSIKEEKKEKIQNIIEDEEYAINQSEITTENDFVNYIDDVSDEVDALVDKETISKSDEKTLKNTFIALTDFIFYDGEIKGKKFSDLTNSAKEKVIDIYTKIDNKIESKVPNYKETIKSTSKNAYNNVKEKAADLKEKIVSEYKEKVGEDGYQSTVDNYEAGKNDAKDVYDTYKPYIDSGKSKAKSAYESAKEKVSNWYKEFKES